MGSTPLPRAVAVIGFNLPTIAAVLDRGGWPDTCFDVRFAYDHEEAAGFVARDIDKIVADWHGTTEELAHLQAFVREFANRPAPPGAPG